MSMKYLCLLRGINVGGNNIIKMAALKKAFEDMGYTDVTTYIQSGNVVFSSNKSPSTLQSTIEKTLSKRFTYASKVVVITKNDLKKAIREAPKSFGARPEKYKYDIIFLKKPLTAVKAIKEIEVREGVDTAAKGTNVLYFSRLTAKLGKSRLSKIVQKPAYQNMTIRNWNTTTKLLSLMED